MALSEMPDMCTRMGKSTFVCSAAKSFLEIRHDGQRGVRGRKLDQEAVDELLRRHIGEWPEGHIEGHLALRIPGVVRVHFCHVLTEDLDFALHLLSALVHRVRLVDLVPSC